MPKRVPTIPVIDWREHLRPAPAPRDLTITEVAEDWLERQRAEGRRSMADAESAIRRHVEACLGEMRAREVEARHAGAWVRALAAAGYAGATVVRLTSYLSCVLEHAVELGAAPRNVVRDLPRGTLPSREGRDPDLGALEVLSLEEMGQLLAACPATRLLQWALYLLTGLRVGEGLALRWSDLHRAVPLWELVVSRSWDSKRRHTGPTKTGYQRRIPIHPTLQRMLDRVRARRLPQSGDLVLRGPGGAEALEQTVLAHWRRDLVAAGIQHPSSGPRRLVATRHTFASQLVRAGVAESMVEALTHRRSRSRGNSCVSVYAHESWATKCRAILALQVEVDREPE